MPEPTMPKERHRLQPHPLPASPDHSRRPTSRQPSQSSSTSTAGTRPGDSFNQCALSFRVKPHVLASSALRKPPYVPSAGFTPRPGKECTATYLQRSHCCPAEAPQPTRLKNLPAQRDLRTVASIAAADHQMLHLRYAQPLLHFTFR